MPRRRWKWNQATSTSLAIITKHLHTLCILDVFLWECVYSMFKLYICWNIERAFELITKQMFFETLCQFDYFYRIHTHSMVHILSFSFSRLLTSTRKYTFQLQLKLFFFYSGEKATVQFNHIIFAYGIWLGRRLYTI